MRGWRRKEEKKKKYEKEMASQDMHGQGTWDNKRIC